MVMTREKEAAQHGVEAAADGLVAVSHELWDNPELAFEEVHSAEVCSDALDRAGFDVTSAIGGLETSFVAEHGTGDLDEWLVRSGSSWRASAGNNTASVIGGIVAPR